MGDKKFNQTRENENTDVAQRAIIKTKNYKYRGFGGANKIVQSVADSVVNDRVKHKTNDERRGKGRKATIPDSYVLGIRRAYEFGMFSINNLQKNTGENANWLRSICNYISRVNLICDKIEHKKYWEMIQSGELTRD